MNVQTASVMGWSHQKAGLNNQDAFYAGRDFFCVADGISKVGEGLTSYSEFGARLAVNIAAHVSADSYMLDLNWFQKEYLNQYSKVLDATRGYSLAFLNQHTLSTLLCCKIVMDTALIFGIGDGFFSVDDKLVELPSNNKPQSLSYNFMAHEELKLQPLAEVIVKKGTRISLATDGLRFWKKGLRYPVGTETTPSYLDSLYNWEDLGTILRRMNKHSNSGRPQLLEDDTTAIWITF